MLALDLPGRWTDLVNIALAPVLAVLLYLITGRRRDFWVLLVLAGSASTLDLLVSWDASTLALNLFKVGLWCAAPAFLASRVFVTIYHADPVRHHELAGAVSIYLLLAQVFATLFEAVYILDPTSLHFGENFAGRETGFSRKLGNGTGHGGHWSHADRLCRASHAPRNFRRIFAHIYRFKRGEEERVTGNVFF